MTKLNWSATEDTFDDHAVAGRRGQHLIAQIKEQWDCGTSPDTRQVLAAHPELAHRKSVVLELAYEEFCQREESGEQLDIDQFCERFPDYQTSVRRRLEVHQAIQADFFEPLSEVRWPHVGDTFCGFELREVIGSGAIGRVYLAREPSLGNRLIVLKLSRDGEAEAQLLGQLNHPHVVPVHSVQTDPASGLTAVCMPFLGMATFEDLLDQLALADQGNLRGSLLSDTLIRRRHPSATKTEINALNSSICKLNRKPWIDAVVAHMANVADALAYLHQRQICHRDLKPSNILLSDDGRAMLLDFNLSADLTAQAHRLGGTLPYMSPEHVQAMTGCSGLDRDGHVQNGATSNNIESHNAESHGATSTRNGPDERSDIFGFGVILYQLLTGTLPYPSLAKDVPIQRAAIELVNQQRHGCDLAALNRVGAGRHLVSTVERCLRFNAAHRFQSAADLAAELRVCIGPIPRLKRWVRRRPWVAGLSGLAAGCLMTVSGWAVTLYQPLHQRLYQQGIAAMQANDYDTATLLFEKSKHLEPQALTTLQALARTHLLRESYGLAYDSYYELFERSGDPTIWIQMGYCKTKLLDNSGGIRCYIEADDRGVSTAVSLNNLGRCFIDGNNITSAKVYIDRAIKLNPNLPQALFNRVATDLRRITLRNPQVLVDPQSIEDIEKVLKLGSESSAIRYVAAVVWFLSDRDDRIERAIEHVGRAIELGYNPQFVRNDPLLGTLKDDPRMIEALGRTAIKSPPTFWVYADPGEYQPRAIDSN